tara:strand:- start:32 stop:388 length:357 start_codon:yes stop_codon:yes gene_type:complete
LEFGKVNPLILSLICLVLVGISANLIKLIRENRLLLIISLIPCSYILFYGIYITLGPIDLYEDGTKNYFLKNPDEKELPIVFVLLKFYQYILIIVGAVFGYLYLYYLKRIKKNSNNVN